MKASRANAPVLVVGGGPVGLTLGIELLRRGVACRVLERLETPVTTSRAFTLHARTLEVFALQGLAERFLRIGIRSRGLDFRFMEIDEIAHLDFTRLESPYPFILIINQNRVEEVLRERFLELGGRIEWRTELTSLARDARGEIEVTVRSLADGREEALRPRWVVGCDGIHSLVRKSLGIAFEGDSYTGQEMRMMDVPLSHWPLGDDTIHYLIAENRMLLVTKLPGANYRLLISDRGDSHRTETARADFQLLMDGYFPDVRLGDPQWATVFEIWRRVSASYREGGIFLCGDAAHIHSPAGGQGMNACLHDAFNLGWKLALVARGEAHESLLDSYERERRPIAEQVIAGSHLMHQVMMAHGTSIAERIAITREPGYQQRAVRQVSGVAYTYREGAQAAPSSITGPVAGDRAPDAPVRAGFRVHDLIANPYFTLLAFQRTATSQAAIEALAVETRARFGERVRFQAVAAPSVAAASVSGALVAETDAAHEIYDPDGHEAICLVRPDGYVGARESLADRGAVIAALQSILS